MDDPFQDKACTVGDVMAKLKTNASSDQVDDEEAVATNTTEHGNTVTNAASVSSREETDAFCAPDRVRAYEQATAAADAADGQTRDDEGPVEPRRRRRTRAPRRISASPVPSTSSSDSSVDRPIIHRPIPRSQDNSSHARAARVHRLKMRPGKVDSLVAKRQRSLDRDAKKPPEQPKVSNDAMETHVRRHAYSLDGSPGWTLPLPPRPSHGLFVVKTYNTFSADDADIPAPAVNWVTLRMAREKCTEWLVKHVLLPDPSPRNRNPKPRVA